MVVEERVTKDGQAISRRANELGLRLRDITFFDWSPMFVILMYETENVGKALPIDHQGAKK